MPYEHAKAAAEQVIESVKGYLVRNLSPLLERLKSVEDRLQSIPLEGIKGDRGEDGAKGDKGDPGNDGVSVQLSDVQQLIADEVTKAVQALPVPKDGLDGLNGKDADPEVIRREVALAVAQAVQPIPKAVEEDFDKEFFDRVSKALREPVLSA